MRGKFSKITVLLLVALSMITLMVVFSACSSSSPSYSTTTSGNTATIDLVAQNVAFNMKTITVKAGASITINFNNKDSGVSHNFSLYTDSSATPTALFQGKIIIGPATTTYTFIAPSTPGTYFFRCDIHPTMMTGSFIVQ